MGNEEFRPETGGRHAGYANALSPATSRGDSWLEMVPHCLIGVELGNIRGKDSRNDHRTGKGEK